MLFFIPFDARNNSIFLTLLHSNRILLHLDSFWKSHTSCYNTSVRNIIFTSHYNDHQHHHNENRLASCLLLL